MKSYKTPKANSPDDPESDDWYRSNAEPRFGYLTGTTFDLKPVYYSDVGGQAIFEGDISLGATEDLELMSSDVDDTKPIPVSGMRPEYGIAIVGERYRWPNGIVPYVLGDGLMKPEIVTAAIQHWEERTSIHFVERTGSNSREYPNYLSFESQDGCWSRVGMRGGLQVVSLGAGCGVGSAIHEIGHAIGLWHEQSREDRDRFVRVLWENIKAGMEHNFDQHVSDGDDVGQYDFSSIMHYPATAFSKNGQPTIVPVGGQQIGQRTGLSEGDILAVKALYPGTGSGGAPGSSENVQFSGTVPASTAQRWVTHDWPANLIVIWSVIPLAPMGDQVPIIDWKVSVQRQGDNKLRYYISVTNHGESPVTVEGRYFVISGLPTKG
jgi:hypothetical protein